MKAVFISYNQAHTEQIQMILDRNLVRGFTQWTGVLGRGTNNGEPHYGNHAWPGINTAVLTIIDDERVEPLLASLKALNDEAEAQGLRAFVWDIEQQL